MKYKGLSLLEWMGVAVLSVAAIFMALDMGGAFAAHERDNVRKANEALADYRANHPDANRCRAAGGLPVWSGWSGALIDCKPLPRRAHP